ncbi:MAG: pyridoxamine 5'-phosphate oxidase [Wenzhouxiangellaceae bacterium]
MRMSDEIVQRFQSGFDWAKEAGLPEHNGMTLSTVDPGGRPSARTVLLKGFDADGFVFYTNLTSRKGQQLSGNPNASLVFWWREHEQQVIIEGRAGQVSDEEADAYFATRPRGSQIGAWASNQSSTLESRDALIARIGEVEREYEDRDVPRPPHWSGFRVDPERVEFWYGREFRWHERICYSVDGQQWSRRLLYP